MNKKLQKGLTTTMAVAMGVGIAVPTVAAIAAPATTTTGWVKAGTTWNYLKNGTKATGWVKDGSTWYFLNASGAMQTGWVKDGSTWYFLKASGAMQTGWVKDGASWYFLNASGAMQTGWVKDAGTWYYLFNSGSMAVNTTVDGWKLDGSGAGTAVTTPVAPVVPPVTGPVTVSSVSAISASSFKVVFSSAPADTSKVTFAVKGSSGTVIATTTTWNSTNTEATVASSYSLTTDTYSVDVLNNAVDLGTSSVAITQQAVAKISITSTVLSVAPISYVTGTSTPTATSGEGFATYKVLDQYGTDITNTPLGNNIQWNCGIGVIDSTITKNGIVAIKPQAGIPLVQYTAGSINAYDSDNYVTANASLPISQGTGLISDITLNKLTSPNSDDLNAGNTTGQWYIDFTALDASGNATTNYNLISAGILAVNGGAFLDVAVVNDPNDNTKAAISVKVDPTYAASLAADTQIPITVLTSGGKSATLNVTLKKATSVNTFNVSAPAQMVASGETVTLPFTAVDQNGTAVVNYSDLMNGSVPKVNLTISGGGSISLVRNADGTASVQATMPATNSLTGSLTVYIQSNVTSTGKSSQLTLSVQQPAKPNTVAIDNTVAIPFMQAGATQTIDFGLNWGGLAVNDQYGRAMDLTDEATTGSAIYYSVVPTVTNGASVLSVTGASYGGNATTLTALASGTATVNYEVYSTNAATGLQTDMGIGQSVQYTVVKDTDITDYTLDAITNPIKMVSNISTATFAWGSSGTDIRDEEYAANPYVWGKTAGGAKVVLAGTSIVSATIDSGDFAIANPHTGAAVSTISGADLVAAPSNNFGIYAQTLSNPNATGSSTNFSVTVKDSLGNQRTLTSVIKSTTDSSVISKIGISALNYTGDRGITLVGNTATVDSTNFASTFSHINGQMLTRYDANGSNSNRSYVYFRAYDQFGTKAAPISLVNVSSASFANGCTATVDFNAATGSYVLDIKNAAGQLATAADIVHGDSIVLYATTANGKAQTVQIVFNK